MPILMFFMSPIIIVTAAAEGTKKGALRYEFKGKI